MGLGEMHLEKEKAQRFNKDKPQWSLVDFESFEPMIKVLEFGAKKYAPFNWQKGFDQRILMESLLRHAFAYLSGEEEDPESGLSHIGHIQCNAMFLAFNAKHHPDKDTRHKIDKNGKIENCP